MEEDLLTLQTQDVPKYNSLTFGFRVSGFRGLGFRGLGFRGLGFQGFKGLGV